MTQWPVLVAILLFVVGYVYQDWWLPGVKGWWVASVPHRLIYQAMTYDPRDPRNSRAGSQCSIDGTICRVECQCHSAPMRFNIIRKHDGVSNPVWKSDQVLQGTGRYIFTSAADNPYVNAGDWLYADCKDASREFVISVGVRPPGAVIGIANGLKRLIRRTAKHPP